MTPVALCGRRVYQQDTRPPCAVRTSHVDGCLVQGSVLPPIYALIPVMAMPSVRNRCVRTKTTINGSITMTAAAIR